METDNEIEIKTEGIYIIYMREFILKNKNIYKIGRSNDIENKLRNYPKGSRIMFATSCNNSIKYEKDLIKIFKTKFISTKFGKRYFKGDVDDMKDIIYNYLQDIRRLNTNTFNNV